MSEAIEDAAEKKELEDEERKDILEEGVGPALVDSILVAAGELAGERRSPERQMVHRAPEGGPGFFPRGRHLGAAP